MKKIERERKISIREMIEIRRMKTMMEKRKKQMKKMTIKIGRDPLETKIKIKIRI